MNNPKLKITTTDAKQWLAGSVHKKYDLIIVDFPDPTTDLLWDLYTVKLYKNIAARLHKHSVVAVQSSTYNTRIYELIFKKLDKVFPYIIGYHTGASSVFCGFFLCSMQPIKMMREIPRQCRWLTPNLINMLLRIPVAQTRKRSKKFSPSNFLLRTVKSNRELGYLK